MNPREIVIMVVTTSIVVSVVTNVIVRGLI